MKVKVKSLSHVRLFATPWTVVHQASPSMGFSRQEYWSGLPLPSPGSNNERGHKFLKQLQQQTQDSQFSKRLETMWGKCEKHEKHKMIPILHNSN